MLAGALWAIVDRRWTLLTCFGVPFAIPGAGSWLVALPASLIAGGGLSEIVAPLAAQHHRAMSLSQLQRTSTVTACAVAVTAYLLVNPAGVIWRCLGAHGRVSNALLAAIQWLRHSRPADKELVVLASPCVPEGFAHLPPRTGLNNAGGAGWQPDEHDVTRKLDAILAECDAVDCVRLAVANHLGHESPYLSGEHLAGLRPDPETPVQCLRPGGRTNKYWWHAC